MPATFRLLLGTQNVGKTTEIRSVLGSRCEAIGLADLGRPIGEVKEDGTTYFENALKKAVVYHMLSGLPTLSDDSGLEVKALGGGPGVDSAVFGGGNLSWPERWNALLEKLKPFPLPLWEARFRCVLCFYNGKDVPIFFEGLAPGKILEKPAGDNGFGFDPIVWSTELGMPFAQASADAKNRVSHRAKALQAFCQWLDRDVSCGAFH